MSTGNIFFNFKDITSIPLTGSNVTLTPLIYPIISGSFTAINDPIILTTDTTGSVYYNNVILPNLFKLDFQGKQKVTYYASITSSNNGVDFNGSTYIISASIDNGNPTNIWFDLTNIVSQVYAVKKVRLTPAPSYIPNINSGSVIPGDYKEFYTDSNGTFTASALIPGGYTVQCFSSPIKNIPIFNINVPANSGSLNVNQVIIPSVNQVNVSYPFPNAPGQLNLQQLLSGYQTLIQSGTYFNIVVAESLEADFAILAGNAISASYSPTLATTLNTGSIYQITASQAASSSWAPTNSLLITGSLVPITASWANNTNSSNSSSWASQSLSASWAPNTTTTLNTGSTYQITASQAASSSWSNISSTSILSTLSNNVTNSNAVNTYFPTWLSGKLTNTSSLLDNAINGLSSSVRFNTPEIDILPTSSVALLVKNPYPWVNTILSLNFPDNVNPVLSLTSNSGTNSIILTPTGSVSFNNVGNVIVNNTLTASIIQGNSIVGPLTGTASWASNSISASWSPSQALVTSSTVPITSSWAINSLTASRASSASLVDVSTGLGFYPFVVTSPVATGSLPLYTVHNLYYAPNTNTLVGGTASFNTYIGVASYSYSTTSSYSINSSTASFSPNQGATTLNTSSTYPITSSWSNNAVSASWSQGVLLTGSTVPITSSWANNALTTSLALSHSMTDVSTGLGFYPFTVTSPVATGNLPLYTVHNLYYAPNTNTLVGGTASFNTYVGVATSSYAITASFVNTASYLLGSISSSISSISSSYASSSASSSFALNIPANISLNSLTASFISSSGYITASNLWANSITSNNGLTSSLFGTSSSAISASEATLITGKLYAITSSWAATASIAKSINFVPATSSFAATSRTASLANTASYAITSISTLTSSICNELLTPSASIYLDSLGVLHFHDLTTGNDFATMQAGTANEVINVQSLRVISNTASLNNTIIVSDVEGNVGLGPITTNQLPVPTVANTLGSSTAIVSTPTSSYMGMFNDYIITSGSGLRCGSIFAGFIGNNISYTEYTTNTIGLINVTCSMALSIPNIVQFIVSTTQTSNVYNCRVVSRFT